MLQPTLKQLQYLIALADHASFSEAASSCNVTQSTFSAGIATLENILGQKLADRSRRQILLTPLGEEMAERGRVIVAAAKDLVLRAKSLEAPLTGPLRLGVIPTIAPYLLPRLLPDLQKRFPRLELYLREDISQRLADSLRTGSLDAVLLAFPFDTPGMVQLPLYKEPFVLAAPRGAKMNGAVSLADLHKQTLLLLDEGHCLRDHAIAACKLQPGGDRQAFRATSLATLIQMVAQGYGMTLLPGMAAADPFLGKIVKLLHFKSPQPVRQVGLAWRHGHPKERDLKMLGERIAAFKNFAEAG